MAGSTCSVFSVGFVISQQIENPGAHSTIVSMPELIAQTNMDVQAVNRLREELGGMTHWLQKEPQVTTFFSSTYESPGTAYIEKVKTST